MQSIYFPNVQLQWPTFIDFSLRKLFPLLEGKKERFLALQKTEFFVQALSIISNKLLLLRNYITAY